jgi:hypothetical protein
MAVAEEKEAAEAKTDADAAIRSVVPATKDTLATKNVDMSKLTTREITSLMVTFCGGG